MKADRLMLLREIKALSRESYETHNTRIRRGKNAELR
jgi:hypothetical protein